jgi:hypothetical protein
VFKFEDEQFVNPTNNKVIEVRDNKDEEGQPIIVNTRKTRPQGPIGVTVYAHFDWRGWNESFRTGKHNVKDRNSKTTGRRDEAISGYKIKSGCSVTFYEHAD